MGYFTGCFNSLEHVHPKEEHRFLLGYKMNWTFYVITSLCFLALCDGSEQSSQGQGDSSCDCDSDDVGRSCHCEYQEDGYKERVVVVAVASLTGVGVLGTIVFCCLYNKNLKSKWTKTKPEVFVEVLDSKPPLPHELTWTTIPSAPPPYTCTRLPYYHPESRDTSLSPPPPYT